MVALAEEKRKELEKAGYQPVPVLDEKYRLKNPLGFQVLSYRVDPDASESPVQDLSSDYLSAGTSSESQAQQQVQSVPQPQLEAPTSVDNDVPNASPISVESGNQ